MSAQDNRQDFTPVLLDALLTLKKRELANKAPFKARAYGTVLQQIQQLQHPIHSMDDLAAVKGMGEKIREKLEEIFATGQLQTAEKAKEVYDLKAYDELQAVYGIGPAKATDLIQQGIRSVQALREAVLAKPSLLNDKQKIGLQYYEDLLERIPREEMTRHEQLLLGASPFPAELVGSYRRVSPDSGDIDVLLRIPKGPSDPTSNGKTAKDAQSRQHQSQFYQYVQHLKDIGYLEQILALGEHKCMAICRLSNPQSKARRLDLLMTPDEEYACALLYFTGSDKFNVAFRQHALQRGYTLNEHRLAPLVNTTNPPPFQEEADLFRFLGLQYTAPQERNTATLLPLVSAKMRVRRPQLAKE
jgi:DNA polymerase/3'-5' exonuclease PolX